MSARIQQFLPTNISEAVYGTTAVAIAVIVLTSLLRPRKGPNLDHLPTIGSSTWLGSWIAAITYLWKAQSVLQEGYEKYKGTPFKVSTFYYWMVVVSGRQYVEEFNKSRDEELNFLEGVNMTVKAQYTLGHDVFFNPYHVRILRSNLNRNLAMVYGEMRDEVVTAFDELLDLNGHEWKAVPALNTILKVVARASTRIFVGLPKCRDSDWLDLNIRYTLDVAWGGVTVGFFPEFMAPYVVKYLTAIPSSIRRGVRHLSPIIDARWKHVKEYGSWTDCPNDFLTWLMQEAEGPQRETEHIATRVLSIGFAAIHNTSNAFTQTLYNLAANPQYIKPLREEVDAVIKEEGWSKAAVGKMYKVDSFVKETLRTQGIALANMVRMAMKDVTLSDGTLIPKGSYVVMSTHYMHVDEENYSHAKIFDPFRFAEMRSPEDVGTTKYGFSTTSPEYLAFGHGRHSCPGRFFVSDELVTMLAHVVATYDIKLEKEGPRPQNLVIGSSVTANPTARLMFRKRTA